MPNVPNEREKQGKLMEKEHNTLALLRRFRKLITERFPGFIDKVVLFGSEAREEAGEWSDVDVLVITTGDDWRKGDEIRRIGYELDMCSGARLSIQVLPQSHVDALKSGGVRFIRNIERDAVAI